MPVSTLRCRDLFERERERPSSRQTPARFVEVFEEALSNVIAFANIEPQPRRVNGVHAGRAWRSFKYCAIAERVAIVAVTGQDVPPRSRAIDVSCSSTAVLSKIQRLSRPVTTAVTLPRTTAPSTAPTIHEATGPTPKTVRMPGVTKNSGPKSAPHSAPQTTPILPHALIRSPVL